MHGKRMVVGATIALSLFAALGVGLPAQASETEEKVIVLVPDGTVTELVSSLDDVGAPADNVYTEGIEGASAELTPSQQQALLADIPEATIVPDTPVHAFDTQSNPVWNLDRIDQLLLPMNASFNYPTDGGANARVYVIDTGVANIPAEFGTRLLPGNDFLGDYLDGRNDPNGHGTHVAGTVGSKSYGVAKGTQIVPLRVLDSAGSGYTSDVNAAIEYVIDEVVNHNPRNIPAVISMSLGVDDPTGALGFLTEAKVQSAIDAGISVVVAAGNSGADACDFTPARAPNAITVAATNRYDGETSFTNYGTCVDVFAPGRDITSVSSGGNTTLCAGVTSCSLSGTSMATPAVSGAVALYRSANPAASPAQVTQAVTSTASPNQVFPYATLLRASQSPNKLLNVTSLMGMTGDGLAPAPTTVTSPVQTTSTVSLAWQQPLGANVAQVSDYVIEYKKTTDSTWIPFSDAVSVEPTATVTGLNAGTAYNFRVASLTSYGKKYSSPPISVSTLAPIPGKPTPPQFVTATPGVNSATVNWQAPASANNSTIIDYQLEYKRATDGAWETFAHLPSLSLSHIITGLDASTNYQFRVAANTLETGLGEYSSVVAAGTKSGKPDTPSALSVQSVPAKTVSSISLTWSPPASMNGATLAGYEVSYKPSVASDWTVYAPTTLTTSLTVNGLDSNTDYDFKVRALSNFTASDYSSAIMAKTLAGLPSAPRSVVASAGVGQVALTWAEPSDKAGGTITDYLIQYRTSPEATWVDYAHSASSVPQITVSGLEKDALYYFHIAAKTNQGAGTWSDIVSAKTHLGTPSVPRNFVISQTGVTNVNVAWATPQFINGAPIIDYRIEYKLTGDTDYSVWSHTPSTSLSASLTGLTSARGYTVRIAGVSDYGIGDFTNPITTTTLSGVPSSPIEVSATRYFTRVQLNWLAPSATNGAAITDYVVEYKKSTDSSWTVFSDAISAVPGANVTGLTRGETYDFKVAGKSRYGVGAYAPIVTVTTYLGTPSEPLNLSIVKTNPKSVLLSWTRPASLNGSTLSDYIVQYRLSTDTEWTTFADGVGTLTSARVGGLIPDRSYDFRVAGISPFGVGEYAEFVSVATLSGLPNAPTLVVATPRFRALDLSWVAPTTLNGGVIADYVIQYRRLGAETWLTLADGLSLATTARVAGLADGTSYETRIAAKSQIGVGAFTDPITTITKTGLPTEPRSLALSSTKTSVTATWLAPASNNGGTLRDYEIQYKLTSSDVWLSYNDGISLSTTATIPSLLAGTSYDVRVRARTQVGVGEFSSPVTVSTKIGISQN